MGFNYEWVNAVDGECCVKVEKDGKTIIVDINQLSQFLETNQEQLEDVGFYTEDFGVEILEEKECPVCGNLSSNCDCE